MPKWLRFNKTNKKAQFFIISIVIVIANLSTISFLYSSYSSADLSQNFRSQEKYIFWDVQKELNQTVKNNKCPELNEKLIELKSLIEKEVKSRGMDIWINIDKCSKPIEIKLNLTSNERKIYEEWVVS